MIHVYRYKNVVHSVKLASTSDSMDNLPSHKAKKIPNWFNRGCGHSQGLGLFVVGGYGWLQLSRHVFQANGYPIQLSRSLGTVQHLSLSPAQTDAQAETTPKFLHLPHVKGVSERIECKCRHLGIRTFKLKGTLREPLLRMKELQPNWKKKRVVYHMCLWVHLHWGNWENARKETEWAQRSCEETRCEERDIAVRLWSKQLWRD